MKSKWKKILTAGLLLLASLFVLAGCKLGESLQDVKDKFDLTAQITYYANGGKFEKTKDVKNLYYKTGAMPLEIRDDGAVSNIEFVYDGYDFIDWYHAKQTADGELVFEEGSNVPVIDYEKKADFSKALESGEHWTLVAEWKIQSRVRVRVACAELATGETITVNGKEVGVGDEVKTFKFDGNVVQQTSKLDDVLPQGDYTFVEFYSDAECTQICQWPIVRGDADVFIYARYVKGKWSILKSTADVSKMFGSTVTANSKYLLIKDIDCSNITVSPAPNATFSGVLDGAGFKLSGLKVSVTRIKSQTSLSIFGNLSATAQIKNLTLDNVAVSYETAYLSQFYDIQTYLAYTSIALGASVENVVITGSMSVTIKGSVTPNTNLIKIGDVWTGWIGGNVAVGAESAQAGFDTDGVTVTVEDTTQA